MDSGANDLSPFNPVCVSLIYDLLNNERLIDAYAF